MSNEPTTQTNGGGAGAGAGTGAGTGSSTSMNMNTSSPNTPATGSSAGPGPGPNSTTDLLNASSATQVRPGGAPARVYLNEKVVPYLLEGIKGVTKDQPANPLRVLGEFLVQKSSEVEGGAGSNSKSPD